VAFDLVAADIGRSAITLEPHLSRQ